MTTHRTAAVGPVNLRHVGTNTARVSADEQAAARATLISVDEGGGHLTAGAALWVQETGARPSAPRRAATGRVLRQYRAT